MSTEKITTGRGSLEWVNIVGEGKENMSGNMKYVVSFVPEDATELQAKLDKFWEANKPKGFKKDPKSMGYYPHKTATDEKDENGKTIYEEDGLLTFQFNTGTTYPSGDGKVVKVYNSKNREVQLGSIKIGNGTIGAVAGAMGIYKNTTPNGKTIVDAGVTLYLDRVQIFKLVEFSQDSGFGVSDDDDGWSGDEGFDGTTDDAPVASKGTPRL